MGSIHNKAPISKPKFPRCVSHKGIIIHDSAAANKRFRLATFGITRQFIQKIKKQQLLRCDDIASIIYNYLTIVTPDLCLHIKAPPVIACNFYRIHESYSNNRQNIMLFEMPHGLKQVTTISFSNNNCKQGKTINGTKLSNDDISALDEKSICSAGVYDIRLGVLGVRKNGQDSNQFNNLLNRICFSINDSTRMHDNINVDSRLKRTQKAAKLMNQNPNRCMSSDTCVCDGFSWLARRIIRMKHDFQIHAFSACHALKDVYIHDAVKISNNSFLNVNYNTTTLEKKDIWKCKACSYIGTNGNYITKDYRCPGYDYRLKKFKTTYNNEYCWDNGQCWKPSHDEESNLCIKFEACIEMRYDAETHQLSLWKNKDTLIGESIDRFSRKVGKKYFNKGVFYLDKEFVYFPIVLSVGCSCSEQGVVINYSST